MNKVKCIILKGLMGSGKSTWCKKFLTDNQTYKCSNRDSIRHCVSNYTFNDENEKLVTSICYNMIDEIIKSGYNLILDETNLNEKTMKKNMDYITSVCKKYNKEVEFEIKEFEVTLEEAIRRDANREFSVGEKVIRQAYKRYIQPEKQKANVTHILNTMKYDDNLQDAIIVDLDGSLALNNGTRSYYDYSDKVKLDEINMHLGVIIDSLFTRSIKIILVSGRSDICKKYTEEWLSDNIVPYGFLFMRKEGDDRKDTIIKKEIFEEHIKGKYNVLFALDDRKSVCEMWKSEGIYVLDCSQDFYAKNVF